jgi:hypothetical protein
MFIAIEEKRLAQAIYNALFKVNTGLIFKKSPPKFYSEYRI